MKVFDSLVREIVQERWDSSPVTATLDGYHEHDHLLDVFAAHRMQQTAAKRQRFIEALGAIADDNLDLGRRIDKKVLLGFLASSINDIVVVQQWRRNPALYLQTGLYGIYALLERRFAPESQRVGNAMRRAEAFVRLLEEAKDNIENAPRPFAETALATAQAAKVFFQEAFRPAASALDPSGAQAITDNCLAALDGFADHIRDRWLTADGGDFAIGRAAFAFKLKHEHALPYTPEQVLEIGENARREAVAELEKIAHKIEPGLQWPELISRFKNVHPSRERLLDAYRDEMLRAKEFVRRRGLVTMPDNEELSVVETPLFDRPTTPYAALMPPAPFETEQRSLFYVTPVEEGPGAESALREHSTYSIPVTALHEAYPGHHLQLVLANRNSSPVRKLYATPVMVEGWALYCEEMLYEQGFYPDAATRLFQLKDLLWRACRVILDVRLHTGGISVPAAVNYLVSEAHIDRAHAEVEIARYCATPTYPMSYLIGRQEILRLRQEAEMRVKGRFSLRAFHDELLAWGGIPVAYIRDGVLSSATFSQAA